MAGASLVSLRGVEFRYRGASRPALRDVDFDVGDGEMVVVMGASGAGKSTLAKCIQRSIPAYQPGDLRGTIHIAGRECSSASINDLVGVVALVTQDFEAQLFSTNVVAEVVYALEQMGLAQEEMDERLRDALGLVGLSGFEDRDPTTLSGGEKQRLSIAAALAMRPRLLVFDEPTTDLDPAGKAEIFAVLRALRDRGTAILLIEHEIEAARAADRLVLLADGAVAEDGPPQTLLGRVDRLRELGVRAGDLDRLACALGREPFADFAAALEATRLLWRGDLPCPRTPRPASGATPLVELRAVGFAYAPGQEVLRGVDLSLWAGEVCALVGPNGCGKTTLSKQMNGLLRPTRGAVWRRGVDQREHSLAEIAHDVAYVFQDPDQQIFSASVEEEVRFALDNRDLAADEKEARVDSALRRVGMLAHRAADPFLLPKGLRQRLAVASMLVVAPALLILDEPTTGLDDREQRALMEIVESLAAGGMSILMITHAPWVVAEHTRRCIAMSNGAIVYDGPTCGFLADADLMRCCDFAPPDGARLGAALGGGAGSVEDLLAQLGVGKSG